MMIKVNVTKEIEVDLNEYFKSFSGTLQEEINQAVAGLVTGTVRREPPTNGKAWRKSGDHHHLTADLRVAHLGRKRPGRGRLAEYYAAIKEVYGKNEFMMGDAKKILEKQGVPPKGTSTVLNNLYRGGAIVPHKIQNVLDLKGGS